MEVHMTISKKAEGNDSNTPETVRAAIRNERAKERRERAEELAVTAFTGALKVLAFAFIGAIAGYSAGVGSESYKEYLRNKHARASETPFTEKS